MKPKAINFASKAEIPFFLLSPGIENELSTQDIAVLKHGLNYVPTAPPNLDLLRRVIGETRARLQRNLELRLNFYSNVNNYAPLYPSVSQWRPDKMDPAKKFPLDMFEKHVDILQEKYLLEHFEQLKCKGNDISLIKAIRELRNKEHITIAKADKNMGICIIKTEEFIRFGMEHIGDKLTYSYALPQQAFHVRVANEWQKLRSILAKHGLLNDDNGQQSKLAKSLLYLENKISKPANLQLLFKVHKQPLKIRPIANNFDTMTTNTSIFVHNSLIKYLKFIPTITNSIKETISDLTKLVITDDYLELATIDIVSFYPSIGHEEGLRRTRRFLLNLIEQHKLKQLANELEYLLDLLNWVLTNNYVTFNEIGRASCRERV
jgi:hypothetical protein